MKNIDVVVGAGIAGMVAALLLAERSRRKVILIERDSQLGGHLRCFDYGQHGIFDCGMHNMYETGIAPLDELLFGLLPRHEWQILDRGSRDLAGAVFNGTVQHNSPYPDLRTLPRTQWESCVVGFFRQLETKEFRDHSNAGEDAKTRFGRPIADIVNAILYKQYGKSAMELAPYAAWLTTLFRVVLFSREPFANLMESSMLRERLAWPEQRTLPACWESGRKAYYPKKYGIHRVIDALFERLHEAGVEILTRAQVQSLEKKAGQIGNLILEQGGRMRTVTVRKLIWTSGLPAIAQLLGEDLSSYRFDPPRKTVLVNLLLRKRPNMGDLYYLYCYEQGCHTFRVTNFAGYCEDAPRSGAWPVAVEMLLDAPIPDVPRIKRLALDELKRFEVIASDQDVSFSAVEPLPTGFPMPSEKNFRNLSEIRNRIAATKIHNLTLLGILSEENVFFQRDVLAQVWEKIMNQEETND